jgi:hypothetical protein
LHVSRRGLFYASPLIRRHRAVSLEGRQLLEVTHHVLRLHRRIGIELRQIVPFTAAPTTGQIKRHFALSGWGDGGEYVVGAAAGAALLRLNSGSPYAMKPSSLSARHGCWLPGIMEQNLAAASVSLMPKKSLDFNSKVAHDIN